MFQSILYFMLGFLSAAFIALLAAPSIWRRAVTLTRRRVEASVPLSMNEIKADKDRIRAEFAVSSRKLEMNLRTARDTSAEQAVELTRGKEEFKRLAAEKADATARIADLEAHAIAFRADIRKKEDEIAQLVAIAAEKDGVLAERQRDIDELVRIYEDTSVTSSNRQIDLVAKETEVDKLIGDISMLRGERRDHEKRQREMSAELRAATDALKVEKRRSSELDKRMAELMSALPEREERLERREKELAKLRGEVKLLAGSENELAERLTMAQAERLKLEAEIADMSHRMHNIPVANEVEDAMARLDQERARLEQRLTILTRENKKLRETVSDLEQMAVGAWKTDVKESAALRERIGELAAEVVNLTLRLEGPESPIKVALEPTIVADMPARAKTAPSIADRVRALQQGSRPNA